MSEPEKKAEAQTEIPGTAPKAADDKPAVAAASDARDYAAELKAAESARAKAEKQAKALEAKLGETSGVLEKLRTVFTGGDQNVDPVEKAKALEAKANDAMARYKGAVLRNALTERLVANNVKPDLLKHTLRLVDVEGLEIDDTGTIKNADALDAAVSSFKEEFGSVYFVQPAAPPPPDGKPGVPASSVPKTPGQPPPQKPVGDITPEMAARLPLPELRALIAKQKMQTM